jgi:hypothetical protein
MWSKKTSGEDPFNLGRWSYMTLTGSHDKLITIITAYRVCNTTLSSTGEKTAYKQQFRLLSSRWREQNLNSTPDPHRQFIVDLQSWIGSLVDQQHKIILALDNNEDISSEDGNILPIRHQGHNHPVCPQHYKKIGQTLRDKYSTKQGLSRIFIPASDTLDPYPAGPDPKTWKGAWITITDPHTIAQHICAANTRQYNQAVHTPFGSGYLADTIGEHALLSSAEEILQGTFTPVADQIRLPETLAIIKELGTTLPLSLQEVKSSISTEEFISTYKVIKEATSSSPSGRHVGHYKAAATDPLLSELHAHMMSIPYMAGFSPSQWQKVTDVMLEKNPGSPQIHRLRIIALFESDFNQANRILFARQLGFRLEDNTLIPSIQYGSRPGKQCISAILNKQLTYDIVRHSKDTAAFIENDAVGSYDRLINPLLLLQLRRLGAPSSSTISLSKTWSNTTNFIRTQFGTSSESYTNTKTVPLFGPGQGSTIGPFLWLLCFCLIADIVGISCNSISLASVDHSTMSISTGNAFVDDSYLGASSTYSPSQSSFSSNEKLHQTSAVSNLQSLSQQ